MIEWLCGTSLFSVLQLVKDIRRLVDNGEFLANRHCKTSPVVKLIITLLLELITDHSREVSMQKSSSFLTKLQPLSVCMPMHVLVTCIHTPLSVYPSLGNSWSH